MNYDKLRKLEREYEDWFDERLGAKSVAWVDERRVAKVTLEQHRNRHFDEVMVIASEALALVHDEFPSDDYRKDWAIKMSAKIAKLKEVKV